MFHSCIENWLVINLRLQASKLNHESLNKPSEQFESNGRFLCSLNTPTFKEIFNGLNQFTVIN